LKNLNLVKLKLQKSSYYENGTFFWRIKISIHTKDLFVRKRKVF